MNKKRVSGDRRKSFTLFTVVGTQEVNSTNGTEGSVLQRSNTGALESGFKSQPHTNLFCFLLCLLTINMYETLRTCLAYEVFNKG